MLASQIADLAGLRLSVVTRWHLATHVRVHMRAGAGTVPISRNGHGMDVIHFEWKVTESVQALSRSFIVIVKREDRRHTEWTIASLGWESSEVDAEHYTSAIGIAGSLDGATDRGIGEGIRVGQGRLVDDASGIALDDLSIAELAGGTGNDWAVERRITLNGDGGRWSWRRWVLGADQGEAREGNGENGCIHLCC